MGLRLSKFAKMTKTPLLVWLEPVKPITGPLPLDGDPAAESDDGSSGHVCESPRAVVNVIW